jgi:hypothetical protein
MSLGGHVGHKPMFAPQCTESSVVRTVCSQANDQTEGSRRSHRM